MAQDLKTRAERQLSLNQAAAADAAAALVAARAEVDLRVADPSALTPEQWSTSVGAHQHVELARAALAAELATQTAIRAELAAVTSPADTTTYEAQLRESLTRQGRLRVILRQGREREVGGADTVAALTEAVDAGTSRVADSVAAVAQGAADQAAVQAVLASLGRPPLSTVVADATALRAGAACTAARDRVVALIPAALLARAQHRYAESATLGEEATAFLGAARAAGTGSPARSSRPARPAPAEDDFRSLLAAVAGYAAGAPAELATALGSFESVSATGDLTGAPAAALDPAHRAQAIAAAGAEQDLADAVAEIGILQQALDDAVLNARIDDPDSDPETDPDVVAARAALEANGPQQALTDARAAYGQAAQDALDAWEVEVPASLWDALATFEAATASLDRLASQPVRDSLLAELDAAQDAYADALDDADVQLRRLQVARLTAARRGARAHALGELSADRAGQYARGDGPAGRTTDQL